MTIPEIPEDVCLLVADYGVGDHYIVGGFAEAVRQHHGVRVWMAGRANLAFVASLYPAVERYIECAPGRDALKADAWKIEGGKIFYAHFPELELMRAVGYDGFHFLDAYRCRLGLPATAQLKRPRQPSPAELAAADQILAEQGFAPGRTAVLSIEARTTPTDGVGPDFWAALATELQDQDMQVAINAGPTTAVPAGLRPLSLPLAALRPVVQRAGFFCSVRSGLSDLMCDLRCPQVVVYPEVRYWSGPLHEGTTFSRFGLTKPPHEIVVAPSCTAEQVRNVATYFAARLSPATAGAPASSRTVAVAG
jgi:hypothetical protein